MLVPGTAFATESGNGRTIDFGTFLPKSPNRDIPTTGRA